MIRLVTFDALHTIITARQPFYAQYSAVFAPYIGQLPPDAIAKSFKVALRALQTERPSFDQGAQSWWHDVIKRTALGAGADADRLEKSLPEIVPKLLHRFSSAEGYRAFDDVLPALRLLRQNNIHTAVLSNSDVRTKLVLQDLGITPLLDAIVLSEEVGMEKPSKEIFMLALQRVNKLEQTPILPGECMHIGDALIADYVGATDAGMQAMLLRRSGMDGEGARIDEGEVLDGVQIVENLNRALERIIK